MALLMSPSHQEEKENQFFEKIRDTTWRKKILKTLRLCNAIFYYGFLLALLLWGYFHFEHLSKTGLYVFGGFCVFEMLSSSIMILLIRVYEKTLNLSS